MPVRPLFRTERRPIAGLILALLGALAPLRGDAQVTVFHSPNDDGTAPSQVLVVQPGSHTLHLYLETGTTPSASDPCHLGAGDEVCQWLVRLTAAGPLSFQSFAPVGDVRSHLAGAAFAATGGEVSAGQLGAFKLGDLAIQASGTGNVVLSQGEVATSDLGRESIQVRELLKVPEPRSTIGLLLGVAPLVVLARMRRSVMDDGRQRRVFGARALLRRAGSPAPAPVTARARSSRPAARMRRDRERFHGSSLGRR